MCYFANDGHNRFNDFSGIVILPTARRLVRNRGPAGKPDSRAILVK